MRRLVSLFPAEVAASLLLLAASLAAIGWANSPWADAYLRLLHLPLAVGAGGARASADLHFAINDGLMAIFFLLVGLEIRRELIEGELASPRHAAAPVLAAFGGMVAPALIYWACCRGDPVALRGWAVPVATDIAFSLVVLRLLGRRVPAGLRVFLTAIAIADDFGAIVVIALFYATGIHPGFLAGAAAVWLGMAAMSRAGVRRVTPYLLGTLALWVLMVRSGVHATLAGAAAAFAMPMAHADSPGRALERELRPFVGFVVLPLFGLANAGLRLGDLPAGAWADPVVPGIALGLLLGKPVGVFGLSWAGSRLGLIRLPAGLPWGSVFGMALLCGIGFTVSLFIGDLAFPAGLRQAEVKAAVFAASALSALLGAAVLGWRGRTAARSAAGGGPGGSLRE